MLVRTIADSTGSHTYMRQTLTIIYMHTHAHTSRGRLVEFAWTGQISVLGTCLFLGRGEADVFSLNGRLARSTPIVKCTCTYTRTHTHTHTHTHNNNTYVHTRTHTQPTLAARTRTNNADEDGRPARGNSSSRRRSWDRDMDKDRNKTPGGVTMVSTDDAALPGRLRTKRIAGTGGETLAAPGVARPP